jgi:RNA polymerase sigma factor (sigma-70 family)
MVSSDPTGDSAVRTASQFATTHWSVVLTAADSTAPGSREALETLCRTYWYPLYAFVRLKGSPPEDAKDLTQAFFERFLEKHYVKNFAPEKGRFRTFLLAILQRFLCDQFDRSNAAKRGGGAPVISLDTIEAEAMLVHTAASCSSPEAIFERAWADTVVHTSLDRLREQYEAEGRGRLFEELKVYLSRPAVRADYGATGERLGMSVDAVGMAVVRLRRQYRAAVRAEVANTVATPAEIDDEIRFLVNLLTS